MDTVTSSKFFNIFTILLMLTGGSVEAQAPQPDERLKSLREKMRKDHEMINRLLNDDAFANINRDFHERFKKLLEDFYQGTPEDFFNQQRFDQFFREWSPNSYEQDDSGQWLDTADERILVLKLDIPKDTPLDIKIEKGVIQVSGKTKRKRAASQGKSMIEEEVQFQKAFPIPSDCVAASAQFENAEGEIKIRLRKKTARKATPNIRPLTPKKDDLTL